MQPCFLSHDVFTPSPVSQVVMKVLESAFLEQNGTLVICYSIGNSYYIMHRDFSPFMKNLYSPVSIL